MSTSDLQQCSLPMNLYNNNLVAKADTSTVKLFNLFKEIRIYFEKHAFIKRHQLLAPGERFRFFEPVLERRF